MIRASGNRHAAALNADLTPVISLLPVDPRSRRLGIALPATRIQASAETYIGLVEVVVVLIPVAYLADGHEGKLLRPARCGVGRPGDPRGLLPFRAAAFSRRFIISRLRHGSRLIVALACALMTSRVPGRGRPRDHETGERFKSQHVK